MQLTSVKTQSYSFNFNNGDQQPIPKLDHESEKSRRQGSTSSASNEISPEHVQDSTPPSWNSGSFLDHSHSAGGQANFPNYFNSPYNMAYNKTSKASIIGHVVRAVKQYGPKLFCLPRKLLFLLGAVDNVSPWLLPRPASHGLTLSTAPSTAKLSASASSASIFSAPVFSAAESSTSISSTSDKIVQLYKLSELFCFSF